MELLAIVVLVLGLIGASLLRRHLTTSRILRLREIIHQERLKAMEHGVALPETDSSQLDALLADASAHRPNGTGGLAPSILWVRLVALCLGLTALLGGVGICIGMALTKEDRLYEWWAMGLIPAFLGIGLLAFHVLSAGLLKQYRERPGEAAG